ncbi:MAG: ATP-binding cassette domain-containing protein [Oscillospiraceae bacterium]|nr:ATP-binding cassette domain-containing protein [Oscillospiraceae bacterium]
MLQLTNLTKQFKKGTLAVDNLSLTINDSEVFGLLGANGAGKTTTLRMLATMLSPTSGTATVEGFDIVKQPEDTRRSLGLLFGGDVGLYDRLTLRENILYFAELNDMPAEDAEAHVKRLAEHLDFTEHLKKWAGKCSKGTRQKAAFARAIIHNPNVMLLDEPTIGLDVTARQSVEDFILHCKDLGKTIVLSDHNLDMVERVCDRIGIIDQGKLQGVGTIAELCEQHGCETLKDVFFKLCHERKAVAS